jgi:starch synthase
VVEVEMSRPLKVLVVTAELAPFAKSGGIADVAAALSKELRRLGHDVRAVLPRYRRVDVGSLTPVVRGLQVPLGSQMIECTVYEGRAGDIPVYFVDCPSLYDRDGMYGFGDDDARFIYFSRAVLVMLRPLSFLPDVIHIHDWEAALIPNMLDRLYADGRWRTWRRRSPSTTSRHRGATGSAR